MSSNKVHLQKANKTYRSACVLDWAQQTYQQKKVKWIRLNISHTLDIIKWYRKIKCEWARWYSKTVTHNYTEQRWKHARKL